MTAKLVHVARTKPSCSIPLTVPIQPGRSLTFGRSKEADVYLDSTE